MYTFISAFKHAFLRWRYRREIARLQQVNQFIDELKAAAAGRSFLQEFLDGIQERKLEQERDNLIKKIRR